MGKSVKPLSRMCSRQKQSDVCCELNLLLERTAANVRECQSGVDYATPRANFTHKDLCDKRRYLTVSRNPDRD